MFCRAHIAVLLFLAAPLAHADHARKPEAALPAAQYPLHATHDGITIAVQPGDTTATDPDTRLDYYHHGFLPVRVIVTNDTDKPLILDQARINFLSADGATTHAATDDDLQRRLFSTKSVKPTRVPVGPLSVPIYHKEVDKQILADDDDFGFATTTVAPHSTVSGYLYYDTRQIDEPVLAHATLTVRHVHFASTGPLGNPDLEEFSIALKPTEEAKSEKPAEANSGTHTPLPPTSPPAPISDTPATPAPQKN